MTTCGTCKHWRLLADAEEVRWDGPHIQLPDEQAMAEANQHVGQCAEIDLPDYPWELPENERPKTYEDLPQAWTQDGSHYMAYLWTRDTFGCTLHEAKEPT